MNLSQLKKLIKEELEVILTNEEVGDFFGEDVQRQIEEAGFFPDSAKEEEAEAADLSAQAGSVNVEPMEEAGHKGEGTMARSQLARTGEISHMLEKMIGDDTNLPEWVESKITKAHDYINTVLNYLSGADDDLDPSQPGLELPQIDRDTFDRMKNIGRQRANPRLKYKD